MQAKDYRKWIKISAFRWEYQMIMELPLFDINPISITYWMAEENELILVIDSYVHLKPFTLEQIEEINKTWDKFYGNRF
jgi:hypothetical protein